MSLQYFQYFNMASTRWRRGEHSTVLGSTLTLSCSPCAKAQFGSMHLPSAKAFTNPSELLKACHAWDSALVPLHGNRNVAELQEDVRSSTNCVTVSAGPQLPAAPAALHMRVLRRSGIACAQDSCEAPTLKAYKPGPGARCSCVRRHTVGHSDRPPRLRRLRTQVGSPALLLEASQKSPKALRS